MKILLTSISDIYFVAGGGAGVSEKQLAKLFLGNTAALHRSAPFNTTSIIWAQTRTSVVCSLLDQNQTRYQHTKPPQHCGVTATFPTQTSQGETGGTPEDTREPPENIFQWQPQAPPLFVNMNPPSPHTDTHTCTHSYYHSNNISYSQFNLFSFWSINYLYFKLVLSNTSSCGQSAKSWLAPVKEG